MKTKLRPGLLIPVSGLAILVVVALVAASALRKPKPIPPERIGTVERGDLARSVVARGKIEPLSRVEVKSKANGIIQVLRVEEGDPVTEGQVLAELDKADLQAQVRQAQAVLAGGEANLQAAVAAEAKARIDAANPELTFNQRDYNRAQDLYQAKIASQQQVDDADRALQISKNKQQTLDALVLTAAAQTEQARAQVAAAKAALEFAEESLGYATIRAPISGIVLNRPTEIGDAVSSMLNLGSAATLIMTLGDVSSVYIKGDVDEADIGKTELKQFVRTKVEAYPTNSFAGMVKRIAPMGRDQNNVTTFEVRVTISNPQGKLRVGMTANAEIILEERTNVLIIPETALVYDKDKSTWAQRLDPSAKPGWRKVPLKIGISNGQQSQVLEGLAEGDKFVLP
jgi:HlyD family secretion protein